ncbi:hypothetical protein ACQP1K_27570 [Sphaerimonospora sp. CA-214678]|uniref:hypothetical protein n=1 Tax=Sphaerimonospora TaxID=1792303 RepID=UPI0006E20A17
MSLLTPGNHRRNFISWPMAIIAVVETLPLLLLIVFLSPALLVGPLLPRRQKFTLRLVATVKKWNHRPPQI